MLIYSHRFDHLSSINNERADGRPIEHVVSIVLTGAACYTHIMLTVYMSTGMIPRGERSITKLVLAQTLIQSGSQYSQVLFAYRKLSSFHRASYLSGHFLRTVRNLPQPLLIVPDTFMYFTRVIVVFGID